MTSAPSKGICGQFVKIDQIPTRKVVRLSIECPIEQANHILKQLGGYPDAANAEWIALAPLEGIPPESILKGGKLAQSAGILCDKESFNRWASEIGFEDGKALIYQKCGITSRSHLDHDDEAAKLFKDINQEFKCWLNGYPVPHETNSDSADIALSADAPEESCPSVRHSGALNHLVGEHKELLLNFAREYYQANSKNERDMISYQYRADFLDSKDNWDLAAEIAALIQSRNIPELLNFIGRDEAWLKSAEAA